METKMTIDNETVLKDKISILEADLEAFQTAARKKVTLNSDNNLYTCGICGNSWVNESNDFVKHKKEDNEYHFPNCILASKHPGSNIAAKMKADDIEISILKFQNVRLNEIIKENIELKQKLIDRNDEYRGLFETILERLHHHRYCGPRLKPCVCGVGPLIERLEELLNKKIGPIGVAFELIRELNCYLEANEKNCIGYNSHFHKRMKDILCGHL